MRRGSGRTGVRRALRCVVASTGLAAAAALAQDQAGHAGHAAHGETSAHGSALGPYPMAREGSGTSWQPEATPMEGAHATSGAWSLMAHGFVNVVHDRQTGARGGRRTLTQSMAMGMAQRPLGAGTFGARAMLSLDPLHGKAGYPLLFQTGETADGREPLVDRQHPHDFLMELSASWSVPFGADGAAFVYAGLPGEPALGPPAFMHRFSAMRNPEAPLSHHWLDSTHITFGVVTVGASRGAWKLEASSFNGREPDEKRWNVEARRFDSASARLTWNPTPAWSTQVSHGYLRRPEQLEPETSIHRTTASIAWQSTLAGGPWQTTFAWGLNDKRSPEGRRRLPAWLLESTVVLAGRHSVFARAEQVKNDELFHAGEPLAGPARRIGKLTLGYVFDVGRAGPMTIGVGALIGFHRVPAELDAVYGRAPRSTMLFLQGRV